jgi:uncharacterized membrane protein
LPNETEKSKGFSAAHIIEICMNKTGIFILALAIASCATNVQAVGFNLGEFNITMSPPETVNHISYSSDAYSDFEINRATFSTMLVDYKVTILKPLSSSVEAHKSTPIPGPSVIITNTTMDGKPAVIVIANQYTTVEYVKDEKALITVQFKEAKGTDSSSSIAAAIKSFSATRF